MLFLLTTFLSLVFNARAQIIEQNQELIKTLQSDNQLDERAIENLNALSKNTEIEQQELEKEIKKTNETIRASETTLIENARALSANLNGFYQASKEHLGPKKLVKLNHVFFGNYLSDGIVSNTEELIKKFQNGEISAEELARLNNQNSAVASFESDIVHLGTLTGDKISFSKKLEEIYQKSRNDSLTGNKKQQELLQNMSTAKVKLEELRKKLQSNKERKKGLDETIASKKAELDKKQKELKDRERLNSCYDKLRDFFKNPEEPLVQKYLDIQTKLTVHRLAYTYNLIREGNRNGLEPIIDSLLEQIKTDPKLFEIYQQFKANRTNQHAQAKLISGTMYLLRAEAIKKRPELANDNFAGANYILQNEDFAMAKLLEKTGSITGFSDINSGIVNLFTMIDGSYHGPYVDAQESYFGPGGAHSQVAINELNKLQKMREELLSKLEKKIRNNIVDCSATMLKNCSEGPNYLTMGLDNFLNQSSLLIGAVGESLIKNGKLDKSFSDPMRLANNNYLRVAGEGGLHGLNFCNDPARFICNSPQANNLRASESLYNQYEQEAYSSKELGKYLDENHLCTTKEGLVRIYPAEKCLGLCSYRCSRPRYCSDYCPLGKCTEEGGDKIQNAHLSSCKKIISKETNKKIFTPERKDKLNKIYAEAKNDFLSMLDSHPNLSSEWKSKFKKVIENVAVSFNENDESRFNMSLGTKATSLTADNTFGTNFRPVMNVEGMLVMVDSNPEAMKGTIFHELGHAISGTSCDHRDMIKSYRTEKPLDKIFQCLDEDEAIGKYTKGEIHNRQSYEAIADLFQAQTLGDILSKKFKSKEKINLNDFNSIIPYLTDNCFDGFRHTNSLAATIGMRDEKWKGEKNHPAPEDRINRFIFSNKKISELFGCKWEEIPSQFKKYKTKPKDCFNEN